MILDLSNPLTLNFLKRINSEIGDLNTTLIAKEVENEILQQKLFEASAENAKLRQQVSDMGATNANLIKTRDELRSQIKPNKVSKKKV